MSNSHFNVSGPVEIPSIERRHGSTLNRECRSMLQVLYQGEETEKTTSDRRSRSVDALG